jgi:hypothetical protein
VRVVLGCRVRRIGVGRGAMWNGVLEGPFIGPGEGCRGDDGGVNADGMVASVAE